MQDSPVIDMGDNTIVSQAIDLDGHPRIVDGNGDDVIIVDMGAYEVQAVGASIPTTSEWGLLVMVLLVVASATLLFRRLPIKRGPIATHG